MLNVREYQAQQRAVAEIENGQAVGLTQNSANTTTTQTVLEIALQNDVNKIRTLPTLADRANYKREVFLPKWLPYVENYFHEGNRYQNPVIGYCVTYLFDIDNIEEALRLAEKAIADGQAMPDGFNRTMPKFIADSVLSWAEIECSAGRAIEPYFSQTLRKLCTDYAIHEFVLAKWLKFTAQCLLRNRAGKAHSASVDDPKRLTIARDLCAIAFTLNHKVGVVSLIERINMRLNALAEMGASIPQNPPKGGELSTSLSQIPFDEIARLLSTTPLTLKQVLEAEQCSTDVQQKTAPTI